MAPHSAPATHRSASVSTPASEFNTRPTRNSTARPAIMTARAARPATTTPFGCSPGSPTRRATLPPRRGLIVVLRQVALHHLQRVGVQVHHVAGRVVAEADVAAHRRVELHVAEVVFGAEERRRQ